jgi:hypothetical protein
LKFLRRHFLPLAAGTAPLPAVSQDTRSQAYACAGFGLMMLALAIVPAIAQNRSSASLPDTTPCPNQIAEIATCYSAKLATGAYLLTAIPQNWNGNLIVFAHGGPGPIPPRASYSMGSLARYSVEVKRGFAWIASSEPKGLFPAVSNTPRLATSAAFQTPTKVNRLGRSSCQCRTSIASPSSSGEASTRKWFRSASTWSSVNISSLRP